MKLIPAKFFKNDLKIPNDFQLPLWDYIERSLAAQKIDESYLISLFDITPTALDLWKKRKRDISKDKLVILCNLFGVTIDQLYERDFSNDYQYEDFYGLGKYNETKDYKNLSYKDLSWLKSKINEAVVLISFYPQGYIGEYVDYDGQRKKDYLDIEEIEYYCQTLEINVIYNTKSQNSIQINSITFKELETICSLLKEEWGTEANKNFHVQASKKYDRMFLLSENIGFFKEHISGYKEDISKINYYLKLWLELKKEDENFDISNSMAKVLLANNAKIIIDGKPTLEETLELYKKIVINDIENRY